ncbi:hypothetical protein GCM10011491_37480 [Brucella endophytica]|uniref:Nucleoside-diphosphate kinase n=1 Tax=Brucella endophytica TaxID=1963359 RepID=A0A916SLC8_9HYPH|nr:nucleoside-diphosphate kinase [Brucella endophytica]GGB05900.1 hypothetical protein GCM10011491_37480 [Brucella endophytica]
MSKLPRCQLTTKDFSILEVLLERDAHHDEAFLRLLRQKLSVATILFQDDIWPDVATINSRVGFTVDGNRTDNRILAYGDDGAVPGLTLPVTTIRGLALLGLTAGETIVIERSDGGSEEVRLDKVCHQPQANRKDRLNQQTPTNATLGQQSSVLAFEARRKPTPVNPEPRIDPDDDDPGPRAA